LKHHSCASSTEIKNSKHDDVSLFPYKLACLGAQIQRLLFPLLLLKFLYTINVLIYTHRPDLVHNQLLPSERQGFFWIRCRSSDFLEVCLNTSPLLDSMAPRRDDNGASYN